MYRCIQTYTSRQTCDTANIRRFVKFGKLWFYIFQLTFKTTFPPMWICSPRGASLTRRYDWIEQSWKSYTRMNEQRTNMQHQLVKINKSVRSWIEDWSDPWIPIRTINTSGDLLRGGRAGRRAGGYWTGQDRTGQCRRRFSKVIEDRRR